MKAARYHTLLGVVPGQQLRVHMWEGESTVLKTETKQRKRQTCSHFL